MTYSMLDKRSKKGDISSMASACHETGTNLIETQGGLRMSKLFRLGMAALFVCLVAPYAAEAG